MAEGAALFRPTLTSGKERPAVAVTPPAHEKRPPCSLGHLRERPPRITLLALP